MKKTEKAYARFLYFLFLFGFIVLPACGGGGGGGAPTVGGTPPPIAAPPPQTPPVQSSSFRHFFVGGGLFSVDPSNPTAPTQVDTGPFGGSPAVFSSGDFDPANHQVTRYSPKALLYPKGGQFFKVSALNSDPLTPTQVSNETGATTVCFDIVSEDGSNFNDSVYLYQLGAPLHCFSSPGGWKMVRLGMGPTDSPITLSPQLSPLGINGTLISGNTRKILGFFAKDIQAKNLVRCDAQFQNCKTITPYTTDVDIVAEYAGSGWMIAQVDQTLHAYNIGTEIFSGPLYTFTGTPTLLSFATNDETNYYFGEEGMVLKLPLDGSANAAPLASENGTVKDIRLTSNEVVYLLDGGSQNSVIRGVGKGGGAAVDLVTSPARDLSIVLTAGSWVYYGKVDSSLTPLAAGSIKEDGTGKSEVANALWSGLSVATTVQDLNAVFGKVFRTENCQSFFCVGGSLKSFDAVNNTGEVTLGTLPADMSLSNFFIGIGDDLLISGSKSGSLADSDIFYLNAGQTNSMIRVTNTPGTTEVPLF